MEHEIDKQLGLSAQDAVEKLGVKGYNDACRGIVQRYTQEWRSTITRLGAGSISIKLETMDPWFMEPCGGW